LGQRTVREDVDPDLAAALDVTGHGDTSGLDLPVRHVSAGNGLDAVLAEGDLGTALGHAPALGVVLLAVLDLAGDQHGSALRRSRGGLGGRSSSVLGLRRLGTPGLVVLLVVLL